ncbi:MAG: hypothetical protein QW575_06250 [Thermoproteota archaeon]
MKESKEDEQLVVKTVKAEITINKPYKILTIRITDKKLHQQLLDFFYNNASESTCLNCDMYSDLINTFRVDIDNIEVYFDLGKKLHWRE